jgi:hypothetical protein
VKQAKKAKEKAERVVMVCALADSPFAARASIYTRVCAKCARRLMIAPSGQAILAEHPAAIVMCLECGPPLPRGCRPTAAQLAELATAVPNPWLTRN